MTEAASPRPARASGHPDSSTDWHHAVELLNFTTSEEATIAFERGDVAGAREFLWEPLAAFLHALRRGPEPRSFARAILAGYTHLVRAAKLWETDMAWQRQHLTSWRRGRLSAVVRREWRDSLESILGADGDAVAGGRGATQRVETNRGPLIVRSFRRGGAMRWLGRMYFGWKPRPLEEFLVLLRARRRRLPVPEPIGAMVERRFGLGYQGALVMSEITGGMPLLDFLRAHPDVDIAAPLATGLRRLHDAGLRHPDLNLGNVLVLDAEDGPSVAFVDLDRARLTGGPLDPGARRRGLRRLKRSARKLDPDGAILSLRSLDRIEAIYWHAEPREA